MFIKKLKKSILSAVLVSLIAVSTTSNVSADSNKTPELPLSDDSAMYLSSVYNTDMTMEDIEQLLIKYLDENHKNVEFGSEKYIDFIYSHLFDGKYSKLEQHPDYPLIKSYMVEVLHNLNEKGSKDIETFNTDDFKNKTISEIREEVLSEDEETYSLNEPQTYGLSGYNSTNAVNYAYKWWNSKNNLYNTYHSSDCTNFISQAIYAGGARETKPSNVPTGIYGTTSYWYSDRYEEWRTNYYVYRWKESTPWVRVTDFHSYWAPKIPDGNYSSRTTVSNYGRPGDVVQWRDAGTYRRYHTTMITSRVNGVVYLTYHTNNRKDRSINSLNDATTDWSLLDF